jgi:hypothetical protein
MESASDGIRVSSMEYRHRRPLNIQRDQLVLFQINCGLLYPFIYLVPERSLNFDRHFAEESLINFVKILVLNIAM